MSCKGNCGGCNEVSRTGQKSYVAWIQPCGAAPTNDTLNAMTDGNYPAVKVTNMKREIRGSRTAIRRRLSDGSSRICGYKESTPGDNTINLEFAECGCGGYEPDELQAEGNFDLYQMQVCCGSADLNDGWAKMKIHRCISFNSMTQSDLTSFDTEDDEQVTRSYDGIYAEDYTIYPMTYGEILAPTGLDVGQQVRSFTYAVSRAGCTTACRDACADAWYAVTDEGKVIYKTGIDDAIAIVTIPGYTDNNNANIGAIGSRIVVTQTGGYWETTLSSSGIPGTWTFHAIANYSPNGVYDTADGLILTGSVSGGGVMYKVSEAGTYTTIYSNATLNTATWPHDTCGDKSITGGQNGLILIGGTCSTLSAAGSSPTTGYVTAAAIRPGGEYWIGDQNGDVWYSADGSSWKSVSLPVDLSLVRSIVWADSGIGYILGQNAGEILTTVDGGQTWAHGGARTPTVPGSVTNMLAIKIPCCKNKSKALNNATVVGITTSGTGAIWQGSFQSC